MILHIGLYAGRSFFSIDFSAPFGEFPDKDVYGSTASIPPPSKSIPGSFKVGAKSRIQTGLNHPNIVKIWRRLSEGGGAEVRGTDDVGEFLCGFIYLNSLLLKSDRRVLFLHVPQCSTEGEVEIGKEVTENLIRAMVASYLAEKE